MSTISVRVENQLKNGNYVTSSLAVHGESVAQRLVGALPGMTEAEISKMLRACADSLAQATKTLQQREGAYAAEQADDDAPRARRDLAVDEAQEALISIGHRLQSVRQSEDLRKKYGLASGMPRTPDQLLTVLTNSASLLSNAKETYADLFGQELDPRIFGGLLATQATALEQSLAEVQTEQRELHIALLERDRALAHWGEVYQSVASVLEGLYRLAGFQDLAERIRPTQRRRRGEATPEQPIDDPNLSNPTDTPEPPVTPA